MAKRGRPPHPDILTPREWEVLALLREDLTNEQIADRLGITERTAKYHVAEILGKLGVATRQEAAALELESRRPWWLSAAAPLLFWRKMGLGWLPAAAAGAVVVVVAAGLGLLAWGLLRTQGEGGTELAATPEPVEELVWESADPYQHISTSSAATCGDAGTAERYDVPRTLDVRQDLMGYSDVRVLLGLEAEPYEYVPAQVKVPDFTVSPGGWELSNRVFIDVSDGPARPPAEFFIRRLDEPSLLFRYHGAFCVEEDGSQFANPGDNLPPGLRVVEMPQDIPQIIEGENEGYVSVQEAMDIATRELSPDVMLVKAQLLNTGEWLLLVSGGDAMGPTRPGHEYGFEIRVNAVPDRVRWRTTTECCIEFVTGQ